MKGFRKLGLWFLPVVLLAGCGGSDVDWSKLRYYCDSTKPCKEGFECVNHRCVPKGSIQDVPQDSYYTSDKTEDTLQDKELPEDKESPFVARIAILCEGVPGDMGWTWLFDKAKDYLKGIGYQTTISFSVNPADTASQVEEFVKDGYNVIFAASPNYLTQILAVAPRYTGKYFSVFGGFHPVENVGSFCGRMYQVTWLAGMAAGRLTKTGLVGVVSPFPSPLTVRQINAFARGVALSNPHARVVVRWTLSTTDPSKDKEATQELIDLDCDVIFAQTGTATPLTMVENKGGEPLKTKDGTPIYTIGYGASEACMKASRTCLGSPVWNFGPLLARIASGIAQGNWDKVRDVWEQVRNNAEESAVYMGPSELANEVLGPEALTQIESKIAELAKPSGKYLPFKGPVKDNNGKLRISSGSYPSDEVLKRMCWFVENIREPDGTPIEVPDTCIGDH